MKRFLLPLLFVLTALTGLQAQPFGNEWISYGQRYIKVSVTRTGIQRIDSAALATALLPTGTTLSSIDPRNIQLFRRGQEQYIYISGENDGQFNAADYIEFYGQTNDAAPDSALYASGGPPNPYFSLFSDTSAYFLTWNSSTTNRRLQTEADTSFASYTSAPWFRNEEVFNNPWQYLNGNSDPNGLTDPDFLPDEGFFDAEFFYGQQMVRNMNSRNAYTGAGAPDAKLTLNVSSQSNDWSLLNDNSIRINFLSTQFDTTYDGYAIKTYEFTQPAAALNPNTTQVAVTSINSNGSVSSGRTALGYIRLTYPHTFDLEGRVQFGGKLPDNPNASKSLLEITNISGSGTVVVYDFFHQSRIPGTLQSGIWKALVRNGNGTEKPVFVVTEGTMINLPAANLKAVNGNGSFTDFSAQLGDSSFVIITHAKLMNPAQDYATYRRSFAGGSRHVLVTDVAELYDQFAWGINKHPLGIRHFADYLIQTSPSKPGHLLLIGKSLYPGISRQSLWNDNLVPSAGSPPSDNLLTAGLNGTQYEPAIPTGRIAAKDSATVADYLNKVIDYENNAPEEWMKYILHFGGGTDTFQQNTFKNYLLGYEQIIEDTSFGGIVETYLKTTSAPIQINQSDTLRERIENGVAIMTFFGHASGTGFDQSIDDPSTYNNTGRYPFLIANSCYAGDIHSTGISSSEAFVLLRDRGTIGYLAAVSVGFDGYLNEYTSRLYKSIGQSEYGLSIGENIQKTVFRYQAQTFPNIYSKSAMLEMTLHGDPAVIIGSRKFPDYQISNADVWFDQETQPDSVFIYARITNAGRAVRDSFVVHLQRIFPNNDTATSVLQIPAPYFRDTVRFAIPVDQQRGIGLNRLRISVDYFGQIAESNESNNVTIPDIDLLIRGNAIIPVYPYEFSVIPTDTITLKASTVNAMLGAKPYRFQIDTVDTFNSSFLLSTVITSAGGVVSWKPPVTFTDSTVYYWRVSPDSLTPADALIWRESSFQYIVGKTGWGQAHFYQFKNNGYQYVQYNRPQRRFDFFNDVKTISVKNGIYNIAVPWNESWYKINGANQHIFSCVSAVGGFGMSVAVIDPVSGVAWNYADSVFGQLPPGYYNCVPGQTLNAFDFFDTDSINQSLLSNFIASIPNGHKVLIYSQNWPWAMRTPYTAALRGAFQSIGSAQVGNGTVADSVAYIVFGTKGNAPGTASEVIGSARNSIITLSDTLITNWNEGVMTSPIIGPAQSWGSFHWRQRAAELPDYDNVVVQVIGIQANGTEAILATFPEDSTDVLQLNNYVNATLFPYIKLVARMTDDTSRTPPQFDRWQVLYNPLPDLAVNPPRFFSLSNDTVQEGEPLQLITAIENLTPWPVNDSLLIRYWVIDQSRARDSLPDKLRLPVLAGYTWFRDTLRVPTEGLSGNNELWLEVNPLGDVSTILEPYHFNNVLMVPFSVSTDNINPLLDVTFDGVHIINGDIVSARPSILIQLKDENQFLALNDSSDFRVFLRSPSQSNPQLLSWNQELIFTPAVLPNNSCKILYTPELIQDGTYELIVQAKDRSSNSSGFTDYRITFEVVNKPSVTNVLNYPNPFSTSTQFVFTLTGAEVPEVFTIQIMTITGKVVREIDRDELGELRIGRNITTYAWDGRDEFGDLLANGVYLYRVITRLDGNSVELRQTGADQYFTQGWGKMYLMR
ncbi:MAG: C25 family cysteine peptidase [Bacteroidota bacterium]